MADDRITGGCKSWPTEQDCGLMPGLCHSWKSAGFLVILAAVLEGICFVGFLAVFNGGYARRQSGWKILSVLLFLIGTPLAPNRISNSPHTFAIILSEFDEIYDFFWPFRGLIGRRRTITCNDVSPPLTSTELIIRITKLESRCKLGSRNSKLFPCLGRCSRRRCIGKI